MSALPKILFYGSVKNIRAENEGEAPYIFEFSDRYSVFDWGEMPDLLVDKGRSLTFMAWLFFDVLGKAENWSDWVVPENYANSSIWQKLKTTGLNTHFLSLLDETGNEISSDEVKAKLSRNMSVSPAKIIHPRPQKTDAGLVWNYDAYQHKLTDTLVPLEVIFRFGVPEGSSLLSRASNAEYCKSLGLDTEPKADDVFEKPVVEFSSKLEEYDRYVDYAEASTMAGLSPEELQDLHDLVSLLALRLKDMFAEIGIELWDGKFEFAFDAELNEQGNRDFIIVDSIGPDELRLTYKDVPLSKENLRFCYQKTTWRTALAQAKSIANDRGEQDWKSICTNELKETPPHLRSSQLELYSMMYKSIANALSDKFVGFTVFDDVESLESVINKIKKERE